MEDSRVKLVTEGINQETIAIDECGTEEMLYLINGQDALVPQAVRKVIPEIARATDRICEAFRSGGRLFYIGAGTSGRLGVLDASECPPTYGTSPSLIQAYIAGGDAALRTAVEDCEDDGDSGKQLINRCNITSKDAVVCISASGGAEFVISAAQEAGSRGAAVIGIVNNENTRLSALCDICIAPIVGPEVIVGSTRMKSGTAQKLVLNMITTAAMVKMGKVYGNLMVDLKANNKKLRERAEWIIRYVTGADSKTAEEYLQRTGNNTKLSILMIQSGLDTEAATRILAQNEGRLKESIAAALQSK